MGAWLALSVPLYPCLKLGINHPIKLSSSENFPYLYTVLSKQKESVMRRLLAFCLLTALVACTGCATMIRGTSEPLAITSEPDGATASVSSDQKCITPCQVELKRNQSALIKYTKDGFEPEVISVFPTIAGAGIILGGIIDYGTGAVYSLTPNPAHVILKKSPQLAAAPQAQ
jgi:hypothetical protein